MSFFIILGVVGVLVMILFATLSLGMPSSNLKALSIRNCFFLAAGMYYLAELIEEYATVAAKIFRYLIYAVIATVLILSIFEDVSWGLVICLLLSNLFHLGLLANFPSFVTLSPSSVGTILTFIANHYFGIQYFAANWHPLYQVFSFFTICVWLVPFLFFVSLTANESVLPTTITPDYSSQHNMNGKFFNHSLILISYIFIEISRQLRRHYELFRKATSEGEFIVAFEICPRKILAETWEKDILIYVLFIFFSQTAI